MSHKIHILTIPATHAFGTAPTPRSRRFCARVHFSFDRKFEQAFDWVNMEDDEADFAEVDKGPVLTR